MKCKAVHKCWRALQLEGTRTILMQAHLAKEFVSDILKLEQRTKTMVVILLCKWWVERNRVNAGEAQRPSSEIERAVLSYSTARELSRSIPSTVERTEPAWKPPETGWLKANFDGAYEAENKASAWGFVVRDEEGRMVLVGAGM